MAFDKVISGKEAHHLLGSNVWVGEVTLAAGAATITFADDLPGGHKIESTPKVVATSTAAGVAVGVTSVDADEATVDDDSGASTDDVYVLIIA